MLSHFLCSSKMTDPVLKSLVGKWKMVRSENFDDFMKEMGQNIVIRKLAGTGTPIQTISVDGDSIKVIIATAMYNQDSIMKLNEKFSDNQQGNAMECICYIKDGAFVLEQNPVGGSKLKRIRTTRDVRDGEMFQVIYVGDVICTRVFKRME